jgi:hypothetical protein
MPFRLIRCAARLWRDADGRCGDAAEEEREHQWEWRAHRTSNVSWLDDAATTHTMPQEQSGLCRWALTMSRGSVTKSIKRTEGPKAPRAVAWCFDALGEPATRLARRARWAATCLSLPISTGGTHSPSA